MRRHMFRKMVSRKVPSPTGVGFAFAFTAGAVWANATAELTASNTPAITRAPSHFCTQASAFSLTAARFRRTLNALRLFTRSALN